jgi:hypothetical protein
MQFSKTPSCPARADRIEHYDSPGSARCISLPGRLRYYLPRLLSICFTVLMPRDVETHTPTYPIATSHRRSFPSSQLMMTSISVGEVHGQDPVLPSQSSGTQTASTPVGAASRLSSPVSRVTSTTAQGARGGFRLTTWLALGIRLGVFTTTVGKLTWPRCVWSHSKNQPTSASSEMTVTGSRPCASP